MENLNYKERYLRALRREPVDRVPVPSFCTHPLIELMKYVGLSAPGIHYQVGDMADFAMAAAEVLGFEGVRLPTDGVIEAEAMGCRIEKGDMERNPSVLDHPFSLDLLEIPADLLNRGRIPLLLEALLTVKKKISNEFPVTSHVMGPATILCHLIGPETFLLGFLQNQSEIRRLLNSVCEVCIQMGNALAGAGADVLQFPDPMASSDILSPTLFEEFVLPCYRRIFEKIKCPVVLHICGNSGPILSMIGRSGAIGFSFDAKVNVSDAKAVIGIAMSLVGNISTTNLLDGSAEEVKRESIQAIRDGIHILAPSCGFPPWTPLENVRQMIRTAKVQPEE